MNNTWTDEYVQDSRCMHIMRYIALAYRTFLQPAGNGCFFNLEDVQIQITYTNVMDFLKHRLITQGQMSHVKSIDARILQGKWPLLFPIYF